MKLSISAYARQCGISRATVHYRAKHGQLELEPGGIGPDGKTWYQVDTEKHPPEGKKVAGRKKKDRD